MNIFERHIQTSKVTIIGSFASEYLKTMYHLPNPYLIYNEYFFEAFIKEYGHPSKQFQQWRKDPNKHKAEEYGKYSIDSLATPFSQFAAMMCQMHTQPNVSKFLDTWVSLMDGVIDGFIFYQATILSDNLAFHILYFRSARNISENKIPPFYMSSYIMDVVCFTMEFPSMAWKWTIHDLKPIHIYHAIQWESKYYDNFFQIFHRVMILIYEVIF